MQQHTQLVKARQHAERTRNASGGQQQVTSQQVTRRRRRVVERYNTTTPSTTSSAAPNVSSARIHPREPLFSRSATHARRGDEPVNSRGRIVLCALAPLGVLRATLTGCAARAPGAPCLRRATAAATASTTASAGCTRTRAADARARAATRWAAPTSTAAPSSRGRRFCCAAWRSGCACWARVLGARAPA